MYGKLAKAGAIQAVAFVAFIFLSNVKCLFAAEVADCEGSITRPIRPNQTAMCLKLAETPGTLSESKAKIYFQLAIVTNDYPIGMKFEESQKQAALYLDKAIELNPNEPEFYLFATRAMVSQNASLPSGQGYLSHGHEMLPYDWKIAAATTYYANSSLSSVERLHVCNEAVAAAPSDYFVQNICGYTYQELHSYDKAFAAFSIVVKGYDPSQRRVFGLVQLRNPWTSLADIYAKTRRPNLAVETIQAYWASVPQRYISTQEHLILAGYLYGAGNFQNAADEIEYAINHHPIQALENLRLKQALLLSLSGNKVAANAAVKKLLEDGSLRTILKLQVALKNSGIQNLSVNGKMDGPTAEAIAKCIGNPSCNFAIDIANPF